MAKSERNGKPNDGLKTAAKRVKQRIEALNSILEKVNKRIAQLKRSSAVNAALTRKIEALEKALSEKKEADIDLEEQIKLLMHEVSKLRVTVKNAS